MLSQRQMKEWIPAAVEHFRKVMPPIDAPYPEIAFASNKGNRKEEQVRKEFVEKYDSPIVDSEGAAYMETIHGKKGDAIIIYQRRFNDRTSHEEFIHILWHELGHFFVSNDNNEYFFRFMDQKTHPDDYEATIGYLFWSEFIAEVIACRVTPDHVIKWEGDNWRHTRNVLAAFLCEAFNGNELDRYALADYFARLLADKEVISLIDSAGSIKTTIPKPLTEGFGGYEVSLKEAGIDPEGLEGLNKRFLPFMSELKGYLKTQLSREKYWEVSLEFLEIVGEIVQNMNINMDIMGA